jgi:hypothetical protein
MDTGRKQPRMPPWFALDHAAVIYPANMNARTTAFFRLQVVLDRPVDVGMLATAIQAISRRLPYYHVEMRRGMFWYYFERNREPLAPISDSKYPMQLPEAGIPGAHLYRVRVYRDRIALEISHIITDGTGGMILLKTLLGEYFRLSGLDVQYGDGVLDPLGSPEPGEWEDSFARYSVPGMPAPPMEKPAWHIPGAILPLGQLRITTGRLSAGAALAVAKSHAATLTEYMAAQYLAVLQDIQESESTGTSRFRRLPIKLEIPANMRLVFPSVTMRNFSLFLTPQLDTRLAHYSFDEILKSVHSQMVLGMHKGELTRIITRNVEASRSILVRMLPLPLKNMLMRALSQIYGDRLFSGVLSNLGKANLPEPIASRVQCLDMLLNCTPTIKTSASMISHGDVLSISFGSLCDRNDVERLFFRRLVKAGLHVCMESNLNDPA